MTARKGEQRRGDLWVLAEARKLGFEADDPSTTVVGTGWPLLVAAFPPFALTPMWLTRNRILIYGPVRSALFKANNTREDPTELIWSGATADLRWSTKLRWFMRGETPDGAHLYLDAPSERSKLRRAMGAA